MSLGSWFRDYVYIPMGGNRVSKVRWVFNILTVWMLTGLWHGAAWNFVLWGLFFAAALLTEKWIPGLGQLPAVLRHGYVLLLICFSFVLFNARDLNQAMSDMAAMVGLAGLPGVSEHTLYCLKSFLPLFALGILGATPLPRTLAGRLAEHRLGPALEAVFLAAVLLIATAYLVDGSFSPFLYFRF
jgi:alginate O-acetyltransferase complex protein AlgI